MRDTVLSYNLRGQLVQLEGLGTYTPVVQLDGELRVGHRADMALKKGLNTPGEFSGGIENSEYIDKTGDELVAMWNDEHPDDPVE